MDGFIGVPDTSIAMLNLALQPIGPASYADFDGVLHPSTGNDLFCRLHLLEEALIGKDCQIIISSSWRFHHPFEYFIGLFPASLRGRVAGVIGDAFVGRWPRHSEI